jgi:hypothetical protein
MPQKKIMRAANALIAAPRDDLPVRKLATVFPENDMRRTAAQAEWHKVPATKEEANNLILSDIFRFAIYIGMRQEVDLQRSRVTKGNRIHLCCSDAFATALENAYVPCVGKFVAQKVTLAAVKKPATPPAPQAHPVQKDTQQQQTWPFSTGGFGFLF